MKKTFLRFSVIAITSIVMISATGAVTENTTVVIGTQTWTDKNLDVTTYRNGDIIPEVQNNKEWNALTTGAWCYYKNSSKNGTTYGKLYNWYAVNDPRGLAPVGFHVPSQEEWGVLVDNLGGKNLAGTKVKSTTGWEKNGNGTNSSGFTGLPGGYRDEEGFDHLNAGGYWWSTTVYTYEGISGYYYNYVFYSLKTIAKNPGGSKTSGYSVRCIKDPM